MQHVGDERARFWLTVRIGAVAAVFVIGFLAVVGRVYYLQTVEAEALEERVSDTRNDVVTRQARRGDIRDRNGVELAVSVESPSVYARPGLLGDPKDQAPRIADAVDMSTDAVVERLDTDSPFVWLDRQVHPDIADNVEALDLPGLGTMDEYKRYYPMGQIAGQLLGFVGIDGEGLEGIERQFDTQLAGEPYDISVTRDAGGQELLVSDAPRFSEFEGHSVHLTIDEKVQRVAGRALERQVEKYDARGGHAVAMDVETGDVLAMAKYPSFDPNRLSDFTSKEWRLSVVSDTFEPGSVFKPFLVAAALEEREVALDTEYDLEGGEMQIGGHSIGDIMRRDELTVAQIIQKSSNVGSYKIAQELGRDRYYDYIRAFGFGSQTGLGMPGEASGVVWPPDQWAEITFANVAFGQGLSTTPLQLVNGVAALANGGNLMEPRIVEEVRDRKGRAVWRDEPKLRRRVLSEEVSEQIAWAMSLVTTEEGTGTDADLEHFTVAGKTGTAQQVDPETGTYSSELWVSGFVGFVPAEEPEVAIAVFVDAPEEVRYGGRVAGPAFADIAEEALSQRGTLPLAADKRFELGDEPPEGIETDIAQPAPDDTVVLPPRRIVDGATGDGDTDDDEVPNLVSLTLRQAVDRARELGLVPRVSGWGVVTDQMPAPGTSIDETAELRLTLAPPTETEPASETTADEVSTEE